MRFVRNICDMNEAKNEIGCTDARLPRTGGNENTGLLKVIAIVCMIVDHVGVAFYPRVYELRLIGRVAFPLFAWCLCVGSVYTRNIWKYALRLLLVGILAQPVYFWAMNHQWSDLNIFFELFIGLLAIAGMRENWNGSRCWGPALALVASLALPLKSSYGWQGILFILLLYACRYHRSSIAALMTAFCLYWGQGTIRLTTLFGWTLPNEISFLPNASGLLIDLSRIQFGALLALPLMLIPTGRRLRLPKWIPYAAYPLHLLVIGLIRHWSQIQSMVSQWR